MQLSPSSLPIDPTAAAANPVAGVPLTASPGPAAEAGAFGALLDSAEGAETTSSGEDATASASGSVSRPTPRASSPSASAPGEAAVGWMAAMVWAPPPVPAEGEPSTSANDGVSLSTADAADDVAPASGSPPAAVMPWQARPARFQTADTSPEVSGAIAQPSAGGTADVTAGAAETPPTPPAFGVSSTSKARNFAAAQDQFATLPSSVASDGFPAHALEGGADLTALPDDAVSPTSPRDETTSTSATVAGGREQLDLPDAFEAGDGVSGVQLHEVTVTHQDGAADDVLADFALPAVAGDASHAAAEAAEVLDASPEARVASTPAAPGADVRSGSTPRPETPTNPIRGKTGPDETNSASDFSVNTRVENFAGTERAPKIKGSRAEVDGEKNTLSSSDKHVVVGYDALGTNVAKSSDLMPVASPMPHPTALSALRETAAALPAGPHDGTADAAPAMHAAEAQRTVETVMEAVDRYGNDAKAVNLRFSVSGVDLAVHVSLRGEAIHTTFRTDSPELRSALENQWRAVTEQTDDRSQKLAAPVFTSTKADSFSSGGSSTGGGAQSRDPSARQGASAAPSYASSLTRASSSGAAPAAQSAVAEASRPATHRLLHAFA